MTTPNLKDFATPFNTLKVANQSVYFANDPTRGLTRQRYGWYSNENLFDSSLFTNNPGEIEIQTTASGTDTARLRSSLSGQYVSQALAQPGMKVVIDSGRSFDSNGFVSLDNGRVAIGPFWHDGTQITTGFGIEFNTDGAEIFWKSGGTHKGNSPVPQDEWSHGDKTGQDGYQLDPALGFIYNFPYTWYNAGKLRVGFVSAEENTVIPLHDFDPPQDDPGAPSLETPNLPVQLLVDSDGDASSVTASIGGMQYTLYGAETVREFRRTIGAGTGRPVSTDTPDPINPISTPGDPIYAVKRESGNDDLQVELTAFITQAEDDIRMYMWDVWNDSSALTGASFEPTFRNNASETSTEFDRSATDFTVTSDCLLRDSGFVGQGEKNKNVVGLLDVDARLPIGATRVITATDENSTDPDVAFTANTNEGY